MSMGKITRSKTYNEVRHREIGNRPPRGRPPRRGVIDMDVISPNERPLPEIRLPMPPEPRLNEPRLNEPRVNIPPRRTPPRDVPSAPRPGDSQDSNSQDQLNNLPPGSSTTTTSTVITIKMTTVTHTDANNNSTTTTTVTTDISPVTSNTVSSDPATVTVETSEMPPQITRFPTQITPIIANNNNDNNNSNSNNNENDNVSSNVSNNNSNNNSNDKEKEVNAAGVNKTVSSNQNQPNSVSSPPPPISPTPNTATFPGQLDTSQLQQQMAAVYVPQIASIINNVTSNLGVGSETNTENVFNPHFNNNNVPKRTSPYNPPMNAPMSNGNVIHPHTPIAPNHVPNYHNNPIVGAYSHPSMVQNYPIIPINSSADSGGMFSHHAGSSSNNNFMNIPSHGVNVLDANHQTSAIVRTPSTTTINSNGTIPSPIDSVNGPPISFTPSVHNSDNSSANNYTTNRSNPSSSIVPENTRPRPKYYRLPELDSLDTVYDVWNEWNVGLNGNPSVITLLETYGNKWASENKDPLIARKKIIKEIQIRINDIEIDEVINDMERMRDGRGLTWLAKKFGKKRAPTQQGG